MRQSTIIFGTLSLAFIVYITVRGQLESYKDLFSSAPPINEVEAQTETDTDKANESESGNWTLPDLEKVLENWLGNEGFI
jgi:hypothetical protein